MGARKISDLLDNAYKSEEPDAIRQAIVETGLKHHIVSKYTSLVAVDVTPSRPSQETLNSKNIANNIPHGSQPKMQVMQLARTATNAQFHIISGSVLLILAFVIYGYSRYIPVNKVEINHV